MSWLTNWVAGSLRHKLALVLTGSLVFASLCFLAILVFSYRTRVLEERSFASLGINRLLQVGLENAMLNRDIVGLRNMVRRLGQQDNIAAVMILAPSGEVRFASDETRLGRRYDLAAGELCPTCPSPKDARTERSAFLSDRDEGEVLRSINPVPNQQQCTQCHGTLRANPINGILVVDYDAARIKQDTLFASLALSGAGIVVLIFAIGGIAWVLNRAVLAPVARLTNASGALALGRLGHRVDLKGRDEMARLGDTFNAMADRIEQGVREIEDREDYLQSLVDAMPDGLRVIDENFQVVTANHAFCTQQGLEHAAVVGAPCYHSSHARNEPCAATLVTCPLIELQDSEKPLTCRHRHVSADESEIHVEVSAAPVILNSASKQSRFVVEVIRDLSTDMHVSQEQRLSEIGFLAAGVAHEIHNPLASIRLGIASIERSIDASKPTRANRVLDIIDKQIGRCIDVTSRLLKLSARPTENPELVVLNDVVSDVLSLLCVEALQSNVELNIDMSEHLRVIGPDSELRMMVLNLAHNALHAMPRGGSLTVRGRTINDGKVELVFQDTGVGISNEDLHKIFQPFWSRRADNVHGTGLGLAICRETVRHLGGAIGVSSELGKGTSFTVILNSADAKVRRQ